MYICTHTCYTHVYHVCIYIYVVSVVRYVLHRLAIWCESPRYAMSWHGTYEGLHNVYVHMFIRMCVYIYIYRERDIHIHTHISLSLYIYIYVCIHIYIYIYIERERDREREREIL